MDDSVDKGWNELVKDPCVYIYRIRCSILIPVLKHFVLVCILLVFRIFGIVKPELGLGNRCSRMVTFNCWSYSATAMKMLTVTISEGRNQKLDCRIPQSCFSLFTGRRPLPFSKRRHLPGEKPVEIKAEDPMRVFNWRPQFYLVDKVDQTNSQFGEMFDQYEDGGGRLLAKRM